MFSFSKLLNVISKARNFVIKFLFSFQIPLSTKTPELLFSASEKLADGYAPKFLNDIEVASDGKIYMTDSSTKWGREHHPYVGFENRPDGRYGENEW